MKRLYPNVVLPGMLALTLGLSACSSTQGEGSSGSSGITATSAGDPAHADALPAPASVPQSGMLANPGSDSPASGTSGTSGAAGAGSCSAASEHKQATQHGGTPPVASSTPNGTVVSIEPLAMGGNAGSSGSSGAISSTASGNSTGTNSGGGSSRSAREQAYRITLRMDDGSTQVLNQSSTPTYRSGDRVNLSNGVISR